ncbi:MAG: glycosyltransferase, partial [Phycisphaeraceae bacterium]|nr:glycosyltransferase [Phycisphaeraceae bacterium]
VDATCFCLPSHQEGFSIAITEAVACGVPSVITEGCHFPEVQEANAGFVVPLDSKKVAEALLRILGDKELRLTMSNNGRTLIRQRFTWPIIAEQAVKAYQRFHPSLKFGSDD